MYPFLKFFSHLGCYRILSDIACAILQVLVFLYFKHGGVSLAPLMAQMVKSLPAVRRPRFPSWVRKIPWRKRWQPTQYSCLGNPTDRGVWQAMVHGVTKSQTRLSKYVHPKLFLKLFSLLVSLAISLALTYTFLLSVLPQTFSYLIPKWCWRISQQERDDTTKLWYLKSLIKGLFMKAWARWRETARFRAPWANERAKVRC